MKVFAIIVILVFRFIINEMNEMNIYAFDW